MNILLKKQGLKVLNKLNLSEHVFINRVRFDYALLERMKKDGYMPLPKRAKWETTMLCNLRCVMCHQTERREEAMKSGAKQINKEEMLKIVDNLYSAGVEKILFKGGEIFVRRDFFDVLDYVQEKEMGVNMITNGVLINEEIANKLKNYKNIEAITFSLDGLRETHDRIRKMQGAFDKTVNAIKMLKGGNYFLNIACVIMAHNLEETKGLVELGVELGVDAMTFTMEMFYSTREIEDSKMIVSGEIYQQRSERESYEYSYERMKEAVDYLKSQRHRIFINIQPKILREHEREFFEGTLLQNKIPLGCDTFFELNINEHGEMVVCPFVKEGYANLVDRDLKEAWNCKEMREIRMSIMKGAGMMPICMRCCKLDNTD